MGERTFPAVEMCIRDSAPSICIFVVASACPIAPSGTFPDCVTAYTLSLIHISGHNPGFGKAFTVQKPSSLDYGVGDRVSHVKFGEGTVQSVKDGAKDFEVTVDFDRSGVKKMFASFAKLQKV